MYERDIWNEDSHGRQHSVPGCRRRRCPCRSPCGCPRWSWCPDPASTLITTIVITIMFLFVITSLPLCTLNSRLALNFLNSSDSKICKTFIRNDVVDDNVIGDDEDYVGDENVIDDDGEDLDNWWRWQWGGWPCHRWGENNEDIIEDKNNYVSDHVVEKERMMRISLRIKTMMCLTM